MECVAGPARLLALAALVGSALAFAPAPAATAASSACAVNPSYDGTVVTWVGGHGSSWSNGANWSDGSAPDSGGHASYQADYVCITPKASVAMSASDASRIAGLDVERGASLTLKPGAELYLGGADSAEAPRSYVEPKATLTVLAATLGGNATLTDSGVVHLTGRSTGGKKQPVTVAGSGLAISSGGQLLVDGTGFGGVEVGDGASITNDGVLKFTGSGYFAMAAGTTITDDPHSALELDSIGGIYPAGTPTASLIQDGPVTRAGDGNSVVGVPTTFGGKVKVTISKGGFVVDNPAPPKATLSRGTSYGSGSCQQVRFNLCRVPDAIAADPQVAYVTTSSEAGSPTHQPIRVAVSAHGPTSIAGHKIIGHVVTVTAPTGHTWHSTHLHFTYDASLRGVSSTSEPSVWRDGHKITYCAAHVLTSVNTSCVSVVTRLHGGPDNGDLSLFVITIQPKATWAVT